MLYSLIRPLVFQIDPERAHNLALSSLDLAHKMQLHRLINDRSPRKEVHVMGLTFPNPVGLAAGMDKNGDHIDSLASLGFGFLEIGTVTPRPQTGNPKPRLFRLPEHSAIINRMGFNNHGVANLLRNVEQSRFQGVLGINIGKNANTPIEQAKDDYLYCFEHVYTQASYIAVNISSPNTKNLRQLQGGDELDDLLSALKRKQLELSDKHGRYVPFAVKIAPDLDIPQIQNIAQLLMRHKIDAVIATNTTLARDAIQGHPLAPEAGGLSGLPVREKATEVIYQLAKALDQSLPIIGVGGIMCGQDAVDKISAGAKLVQLYSGLVFRGPGLISEAVNALEKNPARIHVKESL